MLSFTFVDLFKLKSTGLFLFLVVIIAISSATYANTGHEENNSSRFVKDQVPSNKASISCHTYETSQVT